MSTNFLTLSLVLRIWLSTWNFHRKKVLLINQGLLFRGWYLTFYFIFLTNEWYLLTIKCCLSVSIPYVPAINISRGLIHFMDSWIAKLHHGHLSNADGNGDWVLTIFTALSLVSSGSFRFNISSLLLYITSYSDFTERHPKRSKVFWLHGFSSAL